MDGKGIVTSANGLVEVDYELRVSYDEIKTTLRSEPTIVAIRHLAILSGWIHPVCCPLNEVASLEIGGKYPTVKFAYLDAAGAVEGIEPNRS